MGRRLGAGVAGILLVMAGYLAVDRFVITDKERIADLLTMSCRMVETKNLAGCGRLLSERYNDDYGRDRQRTIDTLVLLFGEFERIRIAILKKRIVVDEGAARALVDTRVYTTVKDLGESPDLLRWEIKLSREEPRIWRIIKISFLAEGPEVLPEPPAKK